MVVKKIFQILKEIGIINTLLLNFKYLPFNQALKFPIVASRHLRIRKANGTVILKEIRPGCIMLGFDCVGIFDNKKSRSIWEVGADSILEFKGRAKLGNGFKISVGGGKLAMGQQFTITSECSIICNHDIKFGDHCLISWDTLIMDTDFHRIYDNNHEYINPPKRIIIGNNVWIGCRSTILKGSQIPNNSIIAAGCIVSSTLTDSNAIYGGNPLRQLKNNIYWER